MAERKTQKLNLFRRPLSILLIRASTRPVSSSADLNYHQNKYFSATYNVSILSVTTHKSQLFPRQTFQGKKRTNTNQSNNNAASLTPFIINLASFFSFFLVTASSSKVLSIIDHQRDPCQAVRLDTS